MEKINRGRFVKPSLMCFVILFFLPLCNISYIYAAKAAGISVDAESYRTKGYEAQQRGDIDAAIEWYQKAANLRPDYAAPHNDLGILFETKGWLDRAEAEYEKAIAIDPDYKEVHTNLALLYERKGELEKAAFHWMRRYKLGSPDDPWTEEARSRLEKLGLIDKAKKASPRLEHPPEKKLKPAPKKEVKKSKELKPKKSSDWARMDSQKKEKPVVKEPSISRRALDKELQESLKLAEERIRKEKTGKANTLATKKQVEARIVSDSQANISYNRAKDYYNKGEYAKALDTIRLAKQNSTENKALIELEEEIKFKMKGERIEDHYKEGMIHYRQRDFTGARKEFEAILSILPE